MKYFIKIENDREILPFKKALDDHGFDVNFLMCFFPLYISFDQETKICEYIGETDWNDIPQIMSEYENKNFLTFEEWKLISAVHE